MDIRTRGSQATASHDWEEHDSLDEAQNRFVRLRVAGCTTIVVEVDGEAYRWTQSRIAHVTSSGWKDDESPFDERTAKAEKYGFQTT